MSSEERIKTRAYRVFKGDGLVKSLDKEQSSILDDTAGWY